MSEEFNVIGPDVAVSELIQKLKDSPHNTLGPKARIVSEVWPAKPDERDVNIILDNSPHIDELYEWAEELGVTVRLL